VPSWVSTATEHGQGAQRLLIVSALGLSTERVRTRHSADNDLPVTRAATAGRLLILTTTQIAMDLDLLQYE
jgi:hypothetical protein